MNTRDFSKFGSREIRMARDLLTAYIEKNDSKHLGSDIAIEFNRNSAMVFLVDEDFNVAMVSGGRLVDFYSCPNCGHEGLATEFLEHSKDCCKEYFNEVEGVEDER